MGRKPLQTAVETSVLERSRRRCALCWGLEHDLDVKQVQIAHIDHNASNDAEDNLVAMCLVHHDQYDTKPQQTRRLTPEEARRYRDELYDLLDKKRRTVASTFINPAGTLQELNSDAQRLGLLVEAFDEDVARETPNGLRILHLTRHFIEVDGDFAAGQEGIRCLLRLIEHEGVERTSEAATYLLRRNAQPVAAPLVSLAHAFCAAAKTDGLLFLSLRVLTSQWAFQGDKRGFRDVTIDEVPRAQADALCTCLTGMAHGIPLAPEIGAQQSAVEDLSTLVSRITIAYALQGFEFPEGIKMMYFGHHGRVARGPDFVGADGPIHDYERGRWPPDLWFNCMHMIAGLPRQHYEKAVAWIPTALPNHESLFSVGVDKSACSVESAKHFADISTTVWKGVAWAGPVFVRNETELEEVRAHLSQRKKSAETGLARLKKCIEDERNLVLRASDSKAAKGSNKTVRE